MLNILLMPICELMATVKNNDWKRLYVSYGINIWTGDGHPIYDLTTEERINEDQDVIIGNHVWMGRNVSVHKGGVIPDGCVIGANSFVTKKFYESNCMIAGTPARIIKKNIRWEM